MASDFRSLQDFGSLSTLVCDNQIREAWRVRVRAAFLSMEPEPRDHRRAVWLDCPGGVCHHGSLAAVALRSKLAVCRVCGVFGTRVEFSRPTGHREIHIESGRTYFP